MNQFNVSGTRILNKALISLAILAITLPVIGCSSNDNVKSFGKMEQKNHNLQGRLLPSPIEKNNVAAYFGFLAQIIWLMLTIMLQIWGILCFNGVMMLLHFRNIFRMRQISSNPNLQATRYKILRWKLKSKKKARQK